MSHSHFYFYLFVFIDFFTVLLVRDLLDNICRGFFGLRIKYRYNKDHDFRFREEQIERYIILEKFEIRDNDYSFDLFSHLVCIFLFEK